MTTSSVAHNVFHGMRAKIRKKHQLKHALRKWEQQHSQKASQAEEIHLNGMIPPIEGMESSTLRSLKNCRHLSLSTNKIDHIEDLSGMIKLEVLSLGRNQITRIENLNVARTLSQLWISFNDIQSLKGIEALKQLTVLSVAHNRISEWSEFRRLQHLPKLEELIFSGNPLHTKFPGTKKEWRRAVLRRLPNLRHLDGETFHVIKRVSSKSTLSTTQLQQVEEDQDMNT